MKADNLNDSNDTKRTEIFKDLPTIFELNAHDHFHSLIQPALKHMIKVLSRREGRDGHSDEIACLSHLLVECLFLRFNGSSFGEFFYELKRVRTSGKKSCHKSSLILLYLVLLPYLKSKLDTTYIDRIDEINSNNKTSCFLHFLKLYPQLNATYEALVLLFQFSYVLGRSFHYSPLLRIMSVVLVRNPTPDEEEDVHQDTPFKMLRKLNLKSLMANVALMLVGCLQFVEWWQREDRPAIDLFPTHIPPSPPALESGDAHVFTLCPLCALQRIDDTVVVSSGYVFCRGCIETYVRDQQKCPVTGFPCSMHSLVPLYLQ